MSLSMKNQISSIAILLRNDQHVQCFKWASKVWEVNYLGFFNSKVKWEQLTVHSISGKSGLLSQNLFSSKNSLSYCILSERIRHSWSTVKCMNNLIVHNTYRKCSFCFLIFAPQKNDPLIVSMTSPISLALQALLLLSDRPKFSNCLFVVVCCIE